MADDDFYKFMHRSINSTRWLSLILNFGCAALWIMNLSWGALFFVPVHLGVGIYTFWNGGRKIRAMKVSRAIKKLQGN